MYTIIADEMGWTIDIPCKECGGDYCNASFHCWVPNKIGNTTYGFSCEKEALDDANYTANNLKHLCPDYKG